MDINEFLGLSYRELERRTNIDKSNWSKYFNNKLLPNWKTVIKISDALQTTPIKAMEFIETRKAKTLENNVVKNNNRCVI